MTCPELEQFLYPYLDGEFGPDERLEVDRHLAGCPDCARKVHEESQFRQELRLKAREAIQAPALQPPPSLRKGVIAGLRREQRRDQYAYWMKLSAAALVVAVAGGVYWRQRPPVRQRFLEYAAHWHAKRLPPELRATTHEQAEAFFLDKLDHYVHVPSFRTATMDGVRLLNVVDKPAAYIAYVADDGSGLPGRRVGLFVFDDPQRELEVSNPPDRPDVEPSSEGYKVAVWREGEIIYEMVSDLDNEDILRLWRERSSHTSPPRPQAVPEPAPVTPPPAPIVRSPHASPLRLQAAPARPRPQAAPAVVESPPPSRLPVLDVRPASLQGP